MVANTAALYENEIEYGIFREPDLNNTITAIAVLAGDKVWDKEKYPDFDGGPTDFLNFELNVEHLKGLGLTENEIFLREFLGSKKLAM